MTDNTIPLANALQDDFKSLCAYIRQNQELGNALTQANLDNAQANLEIRRRDEAIKELTRRIDLVCQSRGHVNETQEHDGTYFERCRLCGVNADDQEVQTDD
jgi:hypothetical protein